MEDTTKENDRSDTTSGNRRPSRHVEAPSFLFRLPAEFRSLKEEPTWSAGDRNARTLAHEDGLRMVLIALKRGARLEQHQTRGWASIYVWHGQARVTLPDTTMEATEGDIMVLRQNIPHTVEAVEECELVLTLTAPQG